MMLPVGNEIVQTVKWLDPNNPPPPDFNHVNTFPITVFDAVKMDMNSDGPTLTDVLASFRVELNAKQPLIPDRPANYLVTYAGAPGAIGSIKMTNDIPLNIADQRTDLIPTEKAIGQLLIRLGLMDSDGKGTAGGGISGDSTIRWSQIIGRPNAYYTLGDNDDGYITQNAVTKAMLELQVSVQDILEENLGTSTAMKNQVSNHLNNMNNPHSVTAAQIGAVTMEIFKDHTGDSDNPHKVTAEQIGLGNVDNTADKDKPISDAVAEALKEISDRISDIIANDEASNNITDILYNGESNTITLKYENSNDRDIILERAKDSIVNIYYNKLTKEFVAISRDGTEKRIGISDDSEAIRLVGADTSEISVQVNDDLENNQTIFSASLVQHGITSVKIADDAVDSRIIKDRSISSAKIVENAITSDKIVAGAITSDKIESRAVTTTKIADRAIEPRHIFTSDEDNRVLVAQNANGDPIWSQITNPMLDKNSVDTENIRDGSITSEKIVDNSITNEKIVDNSITTEKIVDGAITTDKLVDGIITSDKLDENIVLRGTPTLTEDPASDSDDNSIATTHWVKGRIVEDVNNMIFTSKNIAEGSIDGSKIFSSEENDRILGVTTAGEQPRWTTITKGMLDDKIIDNNKIIDKAVTANKIASKSIEAHHLNPDIIGTDHIKDGAITPEKMWTSPNKNVVLGVLEENGYPVYTNINGEMIEANSIGTKNIRDGSVTPSKMSSSDVANRIMAVTLPGTDPRWLQASNAMIADRAINGRTLFSSPVSNRILATAEADTDPLWMQVTSEMIGYAQVKSGNIAKEAITGEHIAEGSIEGKHIKDGIIETENIANRAITGAQLFTSPIPNRVLGISSMPYSDPVWLQVVTDMIADNAVTLNKLAASEKANRVIGVTEADGTPDYIKITGDFIKEESIKPVNLARNFAFIGTPELTIEPDKDSNNLQLATTHWVRELIKDIDINVDIPSKDFVLTPHSIDGTLLMTSDRPGILGIKNPNDDVDFITISEDLIENGAVSETKLQKDLTLFGSPRLSVRPLPSASALTDMGSLIPDCQWVLDRINEATVYGEGGVPAGENTIQNILAKDVPRIMTGTGLQDLDDYEMSDDGCMFRGIKIADIEQIIAEIDDDEDIENNRSTLENGIEVSYISDGDIHTIVEGKYDHGKNGNTVTGTGAWITGGGGSNTGSSGGAILTVGSVGTLHLQNRSVTGAKLFTSADPNRILMVKDANSDPVWGKITSEMIDEHIITGKNLFTSSDASRVLVVTSSNSDPVWGQVKTGMIADNAVSTNKIKNNSVTADKIVNGSITAEKLASAPLVSDRHIFDGAITNDKLADNAVTEDKIKNKSISSEKFASVLELPSDTSVKSSSTNYESRALRNIILSPDAPSGGEDGDIWFRYI